MARRHVFRSCLLALGAGHVVVPAAVIAAAAPVTLGAWPPMTVAPSTPLLLWSGLVMLAGVPPLLLGLRPRRHPFGRAMVVRILVALFLIGAASASAGLRVAAASGPGDSPMALLPAMPGIVTALFALVAMPVAAGLRERRGGPDAVRRTVTDRPGAQRLFGAFEWGLLKLCGLCLAYAAWSLHAGQETGSAFDPLLYGHDRLHGAIAYGAVGGLLAVPFVLPRRVVRPRTVLGGVAKAFALVVLSGAVVPVLDVLTGTVLPEMGVPDVRDVVHDGARAAFAGAAVGNVVFAFLRQLAEPERRDAAGRPIRAVRPDDLRALRASRMGN